MTLFWGTPQVAAAAIRSSSVLGNTAGRRGRNQVGIGDVTAFPVDHSRVLAIQARARRQVVGGSETPLMISGQQEREVLAVVVPIAALHIEHHAPHHFLHVGVVPRQHICEPEEVFVVQGRKTMRSVKQAACRVNVDLAVFVPVKPPDSEAAFA